MILRYAVVKVTTLYSMNVISLHSCPGISQLSMAGRRGGDLCEKSLTNLLLPSPRGLDILLGERRGAITFRGLAILEGLLHISDPGA